MRFADWLIVVLPLLFIIGAAIYSGKYTRSVVDFLAAGRVAGRYVISVGDLTAALSVITLVAGSEASYQTGWYADGILDTLIETDQDTVFHFPTECSEIF